MERTPAVARWSRLVAEPTPPQRRDLHPQGVWTGRGTGDSRSQFAGRHRGLRRARSWEGSWGHGEGRL